MEKKDVALLKLIGAIGMLVWALAVVLRGTPIAANETIDFFLGIAPNFGVGLLLPPLSIIYYPVIFKKESTFKQFILILIGIFILLFASEVIHDKFLNSSFDIYDMIASLVAFGIVALAYKYKKAS